MARTRSWHVAGHIPLLLLALIALSSMVHACSAGSSGGGYYYPSTN